MSLAAARWRRVKRIKAPTLLITSPKDLVFPPGGVKVTMDGLTADGTAVQHVILEGNRGHLDGVLSIKQADKQIAEFLAK